MTANSRSMSQPSDAYGIRARKDDRASLLRTGLYEIMIAGHLDKKWSDWLDRMEITHDEAGYTLLTGTIADQAALYGLLAKIRDLGLNLVSLNPAEIMLKSDEENIF